jgi:small-conductance mechanosensitive channel
MRPGAPVAQIRLMQLPRIHLLGLTAENGQKLLITLAVVGAALLIRYAIVWAVRLVTGQKPNQRVVFWTRQGASVVTGALLIAAIVSIWFDNTSRLATAAGLIGAGLAFALQKVVTAFAGYLVVLRGNTFTVGDRITMGGVRGDVISLGFLQTRIMEMGADPATQSEGDRSWVNARQYTGRVVSVTNDKVFDTPIFNFTREFPFLWEELSIPISYQADRRLAEAILIECANQVTAHIDEMSEDVRKTMEQKYFIDLNDMGPRVYYQLTDNWLQLNLRFIARPRGTRNLKDEVSRLIIDRFDEAGLSLASATYDVVGFPPLRLEGPAADALLDLAERRKDVSGSRG